MDTTRLDKREQSVDGQPGHLYDGQGDIDTSTVLQSVSKDMGAH